jgi:putative membrane protein (TIGR04086 family)
MNLNPKALIVGTAVFAALYFIHLMILPLLMKSLNSGGGELIFGVHQGLGLATCLLSGYIAARIAGRRGFMHGFNVAAIGTVLSALAAVLWSKLMDAPFPGLAMLPFWIFVNGSLAGFAGLFATEYGKENKGEED